MRLGEGGTASATLTGMSANRLSLRMLAAIGGGLVLLALLAVGLVQLTRSTHRRRWSRRD